MKTLLRLSYSCSLSCSVKTFSLRVLMASLIQCLTAHPQPKKYECSTAALTLACVDLTLEMLGPPGPPPAHKGSRNARIYRAAKAPEVVCGCLNQERLAGIYPGTRRSTW